MSDGNKSVNLLETFKYLHNGLPCIPLWRLVQLLCIVGVNALYNYEKDGSSYKMCVHKFIHNIWSKLVGRTKRHVDLIENMSNTISVICIKIA